MLLRILETLRFIHLTAKVANLRKRTRGQVLRLQQRRLRAMLRFARSASPFYRKRFRGINLQSCPMDALPILTKSEMMEHFDDLVTDKHVTRDGVDAFVSNLSNLGSLYLDRYVACHTSGTQGQSSLTVQEPQGLNLTFALNVARGHSRPKKWGTFLKRLGDPDRMAVMTIRPGFHPSGVAFSYMPRAAQRFVRILKLSVFDPIEQTVEKLNAFRPHYITGYASALELLGREQRAGNLRLKENSQLRMMTNMSEPLSRDSRQHLKQLFGAHVSNHYAMGECMALTIGCPFYDGIHLNADLAFLEVVDEKNRPVPPGTPGRKVLITNLYNRVQPMIRYEIGDVITLSPTPCPCGSNLPLIESIQGRTKEIFWVRSNGEYRELPPFLFIAAFNHYIDVAEYEVIQSDRNRFTLRAAPVRGKQLSADRLRSLVHEQLMSSEHGKELDIDVELVDEIRPDPRSGKMKRMQAMAAPDGV